MKRLTYKSILTGLGLITALSSNAATITVTGTGDTIAVDGFVTLREAITASNTDAISGDAPAGSGIDTIEFNIAGLPGTVHTIQPTSALPTITDPVSIDGYSQLGASENTLAVGNNAFLAIELDGTNAGLVPGLLVSAGSTTIQGLVINRFGSEGILVTTAGNNTIRGNFIGTDQTGQLDQGNGGVGVSLLSANNMLGGTLAAHRNLISGNDLGGVSVANILADGNRIINNYIGTNDAGTAAIANTGAGIYISNGNSTLIGGILSGTGNIIAFNTAEGVLLASAAGVGHAILGNSIHSNGALGIDLNEDGVTPNDALDPDVGPNNLQNFAVLSSALTNEEGLRVQGTLESTPNTAFRIEFFSSAAGDVSGYGEGQSYLGFADVTTDALGNATINFTTSVGQAVGAQISSTVTDANNNTSEFSANISVVYQPSSENDDDDDDFFDEDLNVFTMAGPSPFFPPFPPFPAPVVPGAPVPPEAAVAAEANAAVAVEAADESNESAITVAPMSGSAGAAGHYAEGKNAESEEGSGCSTFGQTPSSMIVLLSLLMFFLKHRRRKTRS